MVVGDDGRWPNGKALRWKRSETSNGYAGSNPVRSAKEKEENVTPGNKFLHRNILIIGAVLVIQMFIMAWSVYPE